MMNVLLEQESNLSTIAALSSAVVVKSDNNHSMINCHVQTDIAKGSSDDILDFQHVPEGAFHQLPTVCEPVEIYFKDLSYSVQKMFSNSELKKNVIDNFARNLKFMCRNNMYQLGHIRWRSEEINVSRFIFISRAQIIFKV